MTYPPIPVRRGVVRTDKPWGHELLWALTDKYAAKILTIAPGCLLSLQYHRAKEETIYVLQGRLALTYRGADDDGMPTTVPIERVLEPGDTFHVPPLMHHRFAALEEMVVLLEVSTPELSDVVRIEDRYGRV